MNKPIGFSGVLNKRQDEGNVQKCASELTSLPPSLSRLFSQCGILNISQPYRPPWPVTGIAYLTYSRVSETWNVGNSFPECLYQRIGASAPLNAPLSSWQWVIHFDWLSGLPRDLSGIPEPPLLYLTCGYCQKWGTALRIWGIAWPKLHESHRWIILRVFEWTRSVLFSIGTYGVICDFWIALRISLKLGMNIMALEVVAATALVCWPCVTPRLCFVMRRTSSILDWLS
jgi:hypothetical protein